MILYQKTFFSKHKNKSEFKCLDDSEVLSSDFPGRNSSAALITSVASTASMASMTSIAPFHQKMYWSWWFDHSWHPNDQYQYFFCGMDRQKSNFSLKLATFLLEAGEASLCYFFENWFLCLKISNLSIPNPPSNKI